MMTGTGTEPGKTRELLQGDNGLYAVSILVAVNFVVYNSLGN